MAFEQATRNRLQKFVSDARKLLSEEFTQQLQNTYGLDPATGVVAQPSALPALSPSEQQTAVLLRDTLEHYLAASHKNDPYQDKKLVIAALDRIVREQAFTVLNRLAALRMAEARQFVIESISQCYQSQGFKLYQRIAGSSLGETGQAYQHYLFSVFDELSLDLAVLFDRYSSQGRLFPRETVLLELLDLINHAELEMLWAEDETVGWIYQYWNVRSEIDLARGESRAPRNSREMAVRNQFFTPRYVVEFLVDNTVGKTWYEMQKGQTAILDRCDYLVIDEKAIFLAQGEKLTKEQAASDVQYIPYRAAKDPRCLKVIDPACGSGHFLLYVFDLLITIYEEAWQKESEGGWPVRENFEPLQKTYASFDDFQKNIPALIIAHNLYGIDIDPRAIQIAGLAVWLRGQRYWKEAGVKPIERPTIMRSNLICAEPLIIEPAQLSAYKSKLPIGQSNLLAELLNIIAEKMALAGEMGILLKLEKDIRRALEQVEEEFKHYQKSEIQDDLFGREHIDQKLNLNFSVQGLNSAFFSGAEKQLMNALTGFVNSSNDSTAFKNKLFADDIAHSLAFIDLMKLRFDAIVMNPPFGKPSVDSEAYMESNYPDNPSEVYQAFVDRGQELLVPGGFLGCISSRTGFFLGTFENWRNRVVLRRFRPLLLADLGMGVLDAMVETAAYVFRSITQTEARNNLHDCLTDLKEVELSRNGDFSVPKFTSARSEQLSREQAIYELDVLENAGFIERLEANTVKYLSLTGEVAKELSKPLDNTQYPKMFCIRLLEDSDKQAALFSILKTKPDSEALLETDPSRFDAIPGSPFSYWVSDNLRAIFKSFPSFKSENRKAVVGLQTADDFRFARMWWEVRPELIAPYESHNINAVGAYCEVSHKWQTFAKGGSLSPFYSDLKMICDWQTDGLVIRNLIDVKTGKLKSRPQNTDYYFRPGLTWSLRTSRFSPAALPKGTIFSVRSMCAFTADIEPGVLIGLFSSSVFDSIYKLKLGRFGHPEFIPGVANVLPLPEVGIESNEEMNNCFVEGYFNAVLPYHHDETSRLYTENWFGSLSSKTLGEAVESYKSLLTEQESKIIGNQEIIDRSALEIYQLDESDLPEERLQNNWVTVTGFPIQPENASSFIAKDLLSNLFGRLFGRFWSMPENIEGRDPFDPLPLQTIDIDLTNLPLKDGELKGLLKQGVAPVGQYFNHSVDIVLPDILASLYPESTGLLEDVLAELNVESLSHYFTKPAAFFDYHLSQYSGSSRVAPVYLPLSSSAGNFTVWLFYQKLSRATLFTVLNDVIEPALKSIDEQALQVKGSNSADEAKLSSLLDELKDFRDTIQEILSAGFNCDIDDGVVITAAPLRKLFNHSGWRQELEERWTNLDAGDYEWSKLAFNYWPERVISKCLEDRSIAIAHDLDKVLWEEVEVSAARGNGSKRVWQAKDINPTELEISIKNKIAQG